MRNVSQHREQGFSIVELMVALTIGLILLLGVLQILLANRESSSAQRATARVQENLRLAEFVLSHNIAHAGFNATPDPTVIDNNAPLVFPAEDNSPAIASGAFVSGTPDPQGKTDTLRIRYTSRGGVPDCRGNDAGSADSAVMADVQFYVNSSNTLECNRIGNKAPAQPVAENVQRFLVTYGVDTDGDGSVDTYTENLNKNDGRRVRSIRIQLVLASDDESGDAQLSQKVQRDFTFAHGAPLSVDDRRVYMLMDETIALRNALP